MGLIGTDILEQRVSDLETRYLNLTNEIQIVLGALNESKMYLAYVKAEEEKSKKMYSFANRLEKAIEDYQTNQQEAVESPAGGSKDAPVEAQQ
jgi:hypothetical protein